jgi:hypothetical protein
MMPTLSCRPVSLNENRPIWQSVALLKLKFCPVENLDKIARNNMALKYGYDM